MVYSRHSILLLLPPLSLFPEPVWTSGKRFLTVRRHKVQSDGRTDGRTDGQSARERERDRDPLFLDDSTNGTERNAWQRERERERERQRERDHVYHRSNRSFFTGFVTKPN